MKEILGNIWNWVKEFVAAHPVAVGCNVGSFVLGAWLF